MLTLSIGLFKQIWSSKRKEEDRINESITPCIALYLIMPQVVGNNHDHVIKCGYCNPYRRDEQKDSIFNASEAHYYFFLGYDRKAHHLLCNYRITRKQILDVCPNSRDQ